MRPQWTIPGCSAAHITASMKPSPAPDMDEVKPESCMPLRITNNIHCGRPPGPRVRRGPAAGRLTASIIHTDNAQPPVELAAPGGGVEGRGMEGQLYEEPSTTTSEGPTCLSR